MKVGEMEYQMEDFSVWNGKFEVLCNMKKLSSIFLQSLPIGGMHESCTCITVVPSNMKISSRPCTLQLPWFYMGD